MEHEPASGGCVSSPQVSCSHRMEYRGLYAVSNGHMVQPGQDRRLLRPAPKPGRDGNDGAVGKPGECIPHPLPCGCRSVKQQGAGLRPQLRAAAAAGAPLFAVCRNTAVGGIGELCVERQQRWNAVPFQPADKTENIDEIAVDALKVDDIRRFSPENVQQACGRERTAAVNQSGQIGLCMLRLGVQLPADLMDMRVCTARAAAAADNGFDPLCQQTGVDRLRQAAGAPGSIDTVDLQNFHFAPSAATRSSSACRRTLFPASRLATAAARSTRARRYGSCARTAFVTSGSSCMELASAAQPFRRR